MPVKAALEHCTRSRIQKNNNNNIHLSKTENMLKGIPAPLIATINSE